jgi:coproporphyrinogen III oxidase
VSTKPEGYAEQMHRYVRALQEEICTALERADGSARFREDAWIRPGGGGGLSRVLEGGAVLEKAGVNTSLVHGELPPHFAQRMQGDGTSFVAVGISLVLHPANPMAPTTHANFRFISQGGKSWFGGGADLTPYYLFEEDAQHFHRTLKAACDRHDPTYYPRFKKHCDEYFWLRHRAEARGIGGLFFENMGGELQRELAFVQDCGRSFLPAYLPILERRKALPFTPEQRRWQEIRRGRYVEFNLLYDRGTLFGLETHGRIESILMSLPPLVSWVYDHHPAPGSPEEQLLQALKTPQSWV